MLIPIPLAVPGVSNCAICTLVGISPPVQLLGVNQAVAIPPFQMTSGAVHTFKGEEVLRGLGEPMEKSVALLSVSMQPLRPRKSAVVLLGAGAGAVSKQLAVGP